MTSVKIENLSKKFGNFTALKEINLDIADGKFVCLLGPSGCGKTTLLRLIAGLEEVSQGRIKVDGQDMASVPAHKRNFGMVFQSLALFPHLTVAQNIAYPLRIRGIGRGDQLKRASELLKLVQLPELGDRRIHQLSGGQRQRVAIARALAIDPKLFLLDEPLSALDAKLREHLQIELRQLQQKLGVTTIVVTHDQREAMTMADIVVVMNEGRILQAAKPIDIYQNPSNAFVAGFIGTSNLCPCDILDKSTISLFGDAITLHMDNVLAYSDNQNYVVSIRPEDVILKKAPKDGDFEGVIEFIRDLGSSVEISIRSHGHLFLSSSTPQNKPDFNIGQTVGIRFVKDRAAVVKA